jgi:hypothetical protein
MLKSEVEAESYIFQDCYAPHFLSDAKILQLVVNPEHWTQISLAETSQLLSPLRCAGSSPNKRNRRRLKHVFIYIIEAN